MNDQRTPGSAAPVYEYDSDQNFFCKNGVELTQSDVLAELARLASAEAEVARYRTIHECECDSEVGHDEYCVNNLFDRMEAAEAALKTATEALEQADKMLRWAEFTDEQLDSVEDWRAALKQVRKQQAPEPHA